MWVCNMHPFGFYVLQHIIHFSIRLFVAIHLVYMSIHLVCLVCMYPLVLFIHFKLSIHFRWPNAFTIAGNPPQPKIPYPDKRNGRRSNVRVNTMGPKVPTSIIGSPRSYSTLPKANPRQLHQVMR